MAKTRHHLKPRDTHRVRFWGLRRPVYVSKPLQQTTWKSSTPSATFCIVEGNHRKSPSVNYLFGLNFREVWFEVCTFWERQLLAVGWNWDLCFQAKVWFSLCCLHMWNDSKSNLMWKFPLCLCNLQSLWIRYDVNWLIHGTLKANVHTEECWRYGDGRKIHNVS